MEYSSYAPQQPLYQIFHKNLTADCECCAKVDRTIKISPNEAYQDANCNIVMKNRELRYTKALNNRTKRKQKLGDMERIYTLTKAGGSFKKNISLLSQMKSLVCIKQILDYLFQDITSLIQRMRKLREAFNPMRLVLKGGINQCIGVCAPQAYHYRRHFCNKNENMTIVTEEISVTDSTLIVLLQGQKYNYSQKSRVYVVKILAEVL